MLNIKDVGKVADLKRRLDENKQEVFRRLDEYQDAKDEGLRIIKVLHSLGVVVLDNQNDPKPVVKKPIKGKANRSFLNLSNVVPGRSK